MATDDDILRSIAAGSRRIDTAAFRLLFRQISELRQRDRDLLEQIAALEQEENRARVVDVLPDNAPLGLLIRLRGDATGALYLGNGPTRPLTKVLPQAL
jgi:hypothetical protein